MRVCFVRVLVVGISLLGCATLFGVERLDAQGNPQAAQLKNPVPATPDSIAAGQKVYQRYCRACHGVDGTGGPKGEVGPTPPDLTDATWDHGSSDGEIFSVIKNGIPPDFFMEPWGDRLSDTETWSVVNYIRSLARK
jgi:mono/diheme cytochrome c family protein